MKNYLPGSLGESAKAWGIKQHKISGEFQDRHQDRLFLREGREMKVERDTSQLYMPLQGAG